MQFTVAGASRDGARQTHWSPAARAQMLSTQAIPTHGPHTDFHTRCAVMLITIERDFREGSASLVYPEGEFLRAVDLDNAGDNTRELKH
jgi:hypothetical protein